jgi:hypothetical protein
MVLLPFADLIQTREQEDAPSSSFPNRLHDPDPLCHNSLGFEEKQLTADVQNKQNWFFVNYFLL